VPATAHVLASELRFSYDLAKDIGQTELLAGAVRRHFLRPLGRRRSPAYALGLAGW
jgi:hypothetical protein